MSSGIETPLRITGDASQAIGVLQALQQIIANTATTNAVLTASLRGTTEAAGTESVALAQNTVAMQASRVSVLQYVDVAQQASSVVQNLANLYIGIQVNQLQHLQSQYQLTQATQNLSISQYQYNEILRVYGVNSLAAIQASKDLANSYWQLRETQAQAKIADEQYWANLISEVGGGLSAIGGLANLFSTLSALGVGGSLLARLGLGGAGDTLGMNSLAATLGGGGAVSVALTAIVATIEAVATVIAGAVAGTLIWRDVLMMMGDTSQQASAAIQGAFAALPFPLNVAGAAIQNLMDRLLNLTAPAAAAVGSINAAFANLFSGLAPNLANIGPAIINALQAIPGQVMGALSGVGAQLSKGMTDMFSGLFSGGLAVSGLDIFSKISQALFGLTAQIDFSRMGSLAWRVVTDDVMSKMGGWPPLMQAAAGAIGGIGAAFSTVGSTIQSALGTAWTNIQSFAGQVTTWALNLPGTIGTALLQAGQTISTAVGGWPGLILTALGNVGSTIQSTLGGIPGAVGSIFTSTGSAIAGAVIAWPGQMLAGLSGIVASISSTFGGIQGTITSTLTSAGSAIASIVGGWPAQMLGGLAGILQYVNQFMGSIPPFFQSVLTTVASTIISASGPWGASAATALAAITSTIGAWQTKLQSDWNTFWGGLGSAISGVGTTIGSSIASWLSSASGPINAFIGSIDAIIEKVNALSGGILKLPTIPTIPAPSPTAPGSLTAVPSGTSVPFAPPSGQGQTGGGSMSTQPPLSPGGMVQVPTPTPGPPVPFGAGELTAAQQAATALPGTLSSSLTALQAPISQFFPQAMSTFQSAILAASSRIAPLPMPPASQTPLTPSVPLGGGAQSQQPSNPNINVNVTVQGTVTSESNLTDAIARNLYLQYSRLQR